MSPIKQQSGSTLLVALIMLVLLTLLALSAIDSTSTSIQMVGNTQFREESIAAAQQAIENVISNSDFKLTPPAPQPIDVNGDGKIDYTVTITPQPSCLAFQPVVAGQSGVPAMCSSGTNIGAVCFWTVWDVRSVVSDANSGATVILHQGVNTIAGLNDVVAQCVAASGVI